GAEGCRWRQRSQSGDQRYRDAGPGRLRADSAAAIPPRGSRAHSRSCAHRSGPQRRPPSCADGGLSDTPQQTGGSRSSRRGGGQYHGTPRALRDRIPTFLTLQTRGSQRMSRSSIRVLFTSICVLSWVTYLAPAADAAVPAAGQPSTASTPPPAVAPGAPIPKPPDVAARGYILVDHFSGRVLAQSHADERMEPASLT